MLCISSGGNSTFRSEEVEGIFRLKSTETHRFTNKICICFKSGRETIMECKNVKDATEFYNKVIDTMKKDYGTIIK